MHVPVSRFVGAAIVVMSPMLAAQQHLVVPSAYAASDAVSFNSVAGLCCDGRQQTLIEASHLTALVGRTITAIEFRRTSANETYLGGATNLDVSVSVAPHGPLESSRTFDDNVGPTPVQVFNGTVTIPTSPGVATTTVNWSSQNTIRVPFTVPFQYSGGPLCIDIVGSPVAGQEANWWMADAEFEDLPGTVLEVGAGCGIYGGAAGRWANVAERSLVAGGHAHMFAYGTPYGLAVAAIGDKSPVGTPLSALGFNANPGCTLFLSNIYLLEAMLFVPDADPALGPRGGRADLELKLPATAAALGFRMTTQWLDWSQMATSNAIEWTVAPAIPSLGMALIEGHPQEPTGRVGVHIAHVLRLEYQ